MIQNAILRIPPLTCDQGLTTHYEKNIDINLLKFQHATYLSTLQSLNIQLEVLPALEKYPDSYFVEDTAIILPELIILTNPGAQERRGEVIHMAPILNKYRSCKSIIAPGTLDGGDIIVAEKKIFAGESNRTNKEGIAQLQKHVQPLGYEVFTIPVKEGLHLKSGANYLGDHIFISTPALSDFFSEYTVILTEPNEEYSANCLHINGTLLFPEGYPKTAEKCIKEGFRLQLLDVSEIRKMDGGLTCMSLRI
ncbi:MAG: arginine deiminase family protein [Calditrichia bacterium]